MGGKSKSAKQTAPPALINPAAISDMRSAKEIQDLKYWEKEKPKVFSRAMLGRIAAEKILESLANPENEHIKLDAAKCRDHDLSWTQHEFRTKSYDLLYTVGPINPMYNAEPSYIKTTLSK